MNVQLIECQCCKKTFSLTSPEDIVECRTMDEDDNEVAEREWIFMCQKCLKKQVMIAGDEE